MWRYRTYAVYLEWPTITFFIIKKMILYSVATPPSDIISKKNWYRLYSKQYITTVHLYTNLKIQLFYILTENSRQDGVLSYNK